MTGFVRLGVDRWHPFDPFPRIAEALLVPRDAHDVVLVSGPSWWTPKRLLLGALAILLLLAAFLAKTDKLHQSETRDQLQLSSRQLEILRLVAKGLSNPEIAKVFGISLITVKKHLATVFERIGASSRAEAVAIAMQHHLLTI